MNELTEADRSVVYREGPPTEADYLEAIQALGAARRDLRHKAAGFAIPCCFVCGDTGHTAKSCHHNPLLLARQRARMTSTWICYHCGYEARTDEEAVAHFGRSEDEVARCLRDRAGEGR